MTPTVALSKNRFFTSRVDFVCWLARSTDWPQHTIRNTQSAVANRLITPASTKNPGAMYCNTFLLLFLANLQSLRHADRRTRRIPSDHDHSRSDGTYRRQIARARMDVVHSYYEFIYYFFTETSHTTIHRARACATEHWLANLACECAVACSSLAG